jgi:hypothetical protein
MISEAYEVIVGKVLAIVNATKVALIILDCHTFLKRDAQVNKRILTWTLATYSILRVVLIGVQHDNRVRQDVYCVLGGNLGCDG